jgi:hypothetical protein
MLFQHGLLPCWLTRVDFRWGWRTNLNPAQAINVTRSVEQLCDFIEHQAVREALLKVPVTMPQSFGSLGFNPTLWVGLGLVGLLAALDAFYERAGLINIDKCAICGSSRCVSVRFAKYCEGHEQQSLGELTDLRHLFAHNYVGKADDKYFNQQQRHVLSRDGVALTCAARFDGHRAELDLPHLRYYSHTVQTILGRVSDG